MTIQKLTLLFSCILVAAPGCAKREDRPTEQPEVITTAGGIEMVRIPPGSFQMGSADGQDDEKPVRTVQLSGFLMDRYEVVQKLFRKFQMPDPSHFKNPEGPCDQINWTDGAMFCNERSLAEGLEPCYDEQTWECNFDANGYRLPTEAEWEYACRATSPDRYSFGDSERELTSYAWMAENAGDKTHTVGTRKPNAWGLYDMHGNVAEWCNDFYAADYYERAESTNPRGPAKGAERVLRGGSWNSSPDACRSSYRAGDPSIDDTCLANDTIGFRCVRSDPQAQ